MHSRFPQRILALALVAGVFGFANALPAQVTDWVFYKAGIYEQDTANTMPTAPVEWESGVYVVTSTPGDAGLVTLSGGNISGSLTLEQDGLEWYWDRDYETQAAMNAELPSNATYTLTISGGTLGLLIQSFAVGPEQYPNTPYLTGTSFNTTEQFPATAATTLTWNNPGPLVQASGFTEFGIEDRTGNELYYSQTPGAVTSGTVPASALNANDCHWSWVAFFSSTSVPVGSFGVAGSVGHARATLFEIRTWPFPTASCAWHETHGLGCTGLELYSNDPILGSNWDLTTFGVWAPVPLAVTYFSFGPQNPPLPLGAFGLNAPGCTGYIDLFLIVGNVGGLAQNGQLNVSIAVPAAQSFGGITFYAQTIALTPLTPAGVATSNLVEAMFGN